MVTLAEIIVLISYLVTGFLLGITSTSFGQTLITIIGNAVWTMVITPLLLPVVVWLHDLAFDSRMRK
jgi:hypothetical protein